MAEIRSNMTLTDRVSGTLERVYRSMNRVVNVSNRVNQATQRVGATHTNTAQRMDYFVNRAGKVVDAQGKFISATRMAELGLRKEDLALFQVKNRLRDVGNESQTAGQKIGGMWDKFKGYVGGLIAVEVVRRGLTQLFKISDEYANMQTRLSLVNDGQQTQLQLQREIYESAQRTGSVYTGLANSVAKLNMLAGSAFKSNKESLQFLEIMNKSFMISGANPVERESAMLQLTQAMASGRLQGDELRALSETSPMLLQAIEKYMNISRAELRKLASEGKITSEIVKNAMMQAGEEIEAKFKEMPMTAGRAWQMFKNFMTESFRPLFTIIQRAFKSEGFQRFAAVASAAIRVVVNALIVLFTLVGHAWNFLSGIGQWMVDHWRVLGPIVLAFVTAIAMANAQLIVTKMVGTVITFLTSAWTALNAVVAFFNTLIMANPLVFLITLAVMAVLALMVAFMGLGETVEVVFGFIVGYLFFVGAVFYDVFVGAIDIVIIAIEVIVNIVFVGVDIIIAILWMIGYAFFSVIQFLMNIAIDFINWLNEKFNDLGHAINVVFYNVGKGVAKMAESVGGVVDGLINAVVGGIEGLINSALGGINKMIEMVNKIPGVNIDAIGTVTLNRSNLAGVARAWGDSFTEPVKGAAKKFEKISGLAKDIMGDSPMTTPKLKLGKIGLMNPFDAYDHGNSIGRGIGRGLNSAVGGAVDAVSGFLGLGKDDSSSGTFTDSYAGGKSLFGTPDFDPSMMGNPTGGKLDSVGKIEEEIDVSDEFIKLVKDIAEQKWQQNFITLKPEITNNVTVQDDSEYEDFVAKFNDDLLDAVENAADGI